MTYITKLNQKDNDIAIIFTCSCKCYSSNSLVMMIYQLNIKGVSISFQSEHFIYQGHMTWCKVKLYNTLTRFALRFSYFISIFHFFFIFFFSVCLFIWFFCITLFSFCFFVFLVFGGVVFFFFIFFFRGGGVFIMIGSSNSINSYIFMTE